MKLFLLVVLLAAASAPARAADVGVSVSVGQPGFYGRIDIGDYPAPRSFFTASHGGSNADPSSGRRSTCMCHPDMPGTGAGIAAGTTPVTNRSTSFVATGTTVNMCRVTGSVTITIRTGTGTGVLKGAMTGVATTIGMTTKGVLMIATRSAEAQP